MNNKVQDISHDLIDKYLEEKWDDTIWSFSRINQFHQCPYTWYKTYIEGVKSENYFAYRGSAVHDAMEDYYKYVLGGGKPLDDRTVRYILLDKFLRKMVACKLPTVFNFRNGEDKIINSLMNYKPRTDIIHVERELRFEIGQYKFRGFLDYETSKMHGDYKSTWSADKYLRQQYLYMYAKEVNEGVRPEGFEITEYNNNMNVKVIDYDEGVMKHTLKWANGSIQAIRLALENKAITKSPDNFFCNNLCGVDDCEHKRY